MSPPLGQAHFNSPFYGRRSGPARQGGRKRWVLHHQLSRVVKTLPSLGSKACKAICAHFALLWMGHVAQAPAMTIDVDLSLQGRSTKQRSLTRRFDDPHSRRRHVLLRGSHPCEAQCKIRLDTTLCRSECSGSTCSALDLAGRLVSFGCCAGLSLRLGTETLYLGRAWQATLQNALLPQAVGT